jgi:hypothetical protein
MAERTEKQEQQQISQYNASKAISKYLRSLNGGRIRIDVENQPFLTAYNKPREYQCLKFRIWREIYGDAPSGSNGNDF